MKRYETTLKRHQRIHREITKWLVLATATCIGLALLWPRTVVGDFEPQPVTEGEKVISAIGDPLVPPQPLVEPQKAPVPPNTRSNYPQSEVSDLVTKIALSKGYSDKEVEALLQLMHRESGLRPSAQNPTSSAYGLAQFLDSTWKGTGITKTSDPTLQTEAAIIYIENRYDNSINANNFQLKNGYY